MWLILFESISSDFDSMKITGESVSHSPVIIC